MAKTIEEKLQERLDEIQDLLRKRADIDVRLKTLTGLSDKVASKPSGFSIGREIQTLFEAMGEIPLSPAAVAEALEKRTGYRPELRNVRVALNYLVKKGRIVRENNGYRKPPEKERES